MTFLPEIEWILGWAENSGWHPNQKKIKLFTAKTYQYRSTWTEILSLLCTILWSLQSCRSESTQTLFLHGGKSTENSVSLWFSWKSTTWLQMITLTRITQSALCQMQHNSSQGSLNSASLIAPTLNTHFRWRNNDQLKCLHSFLPAEVLPEKDLQKALTDLCLLFQASWASTWTQLSTLTNVLNTCMILELQPIMLRILPGWFGQPSSAFAKQDWNWQLKSATLESVKLNS